MSSDDQAIEQFRAFLRIKTVSAEGPRGAYQEAVNFLQAALTNYGLTEFKTLELAKGKPILIASWPGTDPSAPSILLNSHYDVVPADDASWKFDPFAAVLEDGKIYARGTQDMKCVCIQYVEAIGRLKKAVDSGKLPPLKRTIHLSFLPDEEIGGLDGAKLFVGSEEFEALNVGMALDEGLANPSDAYTIFYGERAPWWVKLHSTGPTGHGSRFIKRTAIEKLNEAVSKVYAFRSAQEALLHPTEECGGGGGGGGGCSHSMAKKLGDVVTINVTAFQSFVPGPPHSDGFAVNCIPTEATAAMDIRIPPTFPLEEMEKILQQWTQEEGLSYSFYTKMESHHVTSIDDSNPFWVAISKSFEKMGKKIEPEIFPAATDSRYFRLKDVPCFGFSPIRNTPILLHDHNEYLEASVFVEGISVFEALVQDLANL